jgi:hypothetical protein
MEPQQNSTQPPQQPEQVQQTQSLQQQSASDYYNKYRKRSFFLSRLTVISSMAVLILALGINISLLYSHSQNTITSHAAEAQNPQTILPSLPAGCEYQQIKGGLKVVCPTPTPTIAVTVPINVALPQLPPQCTISTTTTGSAVHCTTAIPIPTVAVTLPTTCSVTSQTNTLSCNDNNKIVPVPLPSLPSGCSYALTQGKYYVVCKSE